MLRRWPPAPRDCIVITVAAPLGWADSSTTLADSTRTGMKSYVYASGVENWCYPSGPRDGGALAAAVALRYALAGRSLFSVACSTTDAPSDCGVTAPPTRLRVLAGQVADLAYDGRQLDRGAGGAGLPKGGPAPTLPLSQLPAHAAACFCTLGSTTTPTGSYFPALRARPLGSFLNTFDRAAGRVRTAQEGGATHDKTLSYRGACTRRGATRLTD